MTDDRPPHRAGRVYYNEIDPYAAAWLRNLIAFGHLPDGDVDTRSIRDVDPADLAGYTQCHFFAGIGGWPYALRLAGWPDDRPVWTGSCPCQPLSGAGQRKGHADERHLWPAFYRLIAECCPGTIFGEQVAGALGREWLAGVRADLEGAGYAVGAADLCAAGVGAPHIRQRLFWVADARQQRRQQEHRSASGDESQDGRKPDGRDIATGGGTSSGLAFPAEPGRDAQPQRADKQDRRQAAEPRRLRGTERMGDTVSAGLEIERGHAGFPCGSDGSEPGQTAVGASASDSWMVDSESERGGERRARGQSGPASRLRDEAQCHPWKNAGWLPCLDGKARRIEPGIFPLADGISARVGKLRAAGNAIVPQLAAEFIASLKDLCGGCDDG